MWQAVLEGCLCSAYRKSFCSFAVISKEALDLKCDPFFSKLCLWWTNKRTIRDVWKVHLVQDNWSWQKLIMVIVTLFAWWHADDALFVCPDWHSLWHDFWASVKRVQFGQGAAGLRNAVFFKPCLLGALQVLCWCSSTHGFLAINLMIKKMLVRR